MAGSLVSICWVFFFNFFLLLFLKFLVSVGFWWAVVVIGLFGFFLMGLLSLWWVFAGFCFLFIYLFLIWVFGFGEILVGSG